MSQIDAKISCPCNPRGFKKGHRLRMTAAEFSKAEQSGWAVHARQNLAGHSCECDNKELEQGADNALTPDDTPCTSSAPVSGVRDLGDRKDKTEAPEESEASE